MLFLFSFTTYSCLGLWLRSKSLYMQILRKIKPKNQRRTLHPYHLNSTDRNQPKDQHRYCRLSNTHRRYIKRNVLDFPTKTSHIQFIQLYLRKFSIIDTCALKWTSAVNNGTFVLQVYLRKWPTVYLSSPPISCYFVRRTHAHNKFISILATYFLLLADWNVCSDACTTLSMLGCFFLL